jgi:hypothetical protein
MWRVLAPFLWLMTLIDHLRNGRPHAACGTRMWAYHADTMPYSGERLMWCRRCRKVFFLPKE